MFAKKNTSEFNLIAILFLMQFSHIIVPVASKWTKGKPIFQWQNTYGDKCRMKDSKDTHLLLFAIKK